MLKIIKYNVNNFTFKTNFIKKIYRKKNKFYKKIYRKKK